MTGHILFTVPGAISTFATPPIGAAYLAGNRDVMSWSSLPVVTAIIALGLLLAVTGNMLLSVAIWRSGTLPRWAGLIWAAATLISTFSAPHWAWPPPAQACPPSRSARFSWPSVVLG